MTRRVEPSWTLEASENCLLELRKSPPRLLSPSSKDGFAEASDDDCIQEPIRASSMSTFQEAETSDGLAAATSATASALGGVWKGFRRGSSSITSSSSPGRFFLRASRRTSDWAHSGGHADAIDEDKEDDYCNDSNDPKCRASTEQEEQESLRLALQLYMSQSDFLEHLEQIIEPRRTSEGADHPSDGGDGDVGEIDGGNDEMDEFGDFQSADPAALRHAVHCSGDNSSSSPGGKAVATESRSLSPLHNSDHDGVCSESDDDETDHCGTNVYNNDDDQPDHDAAQQEPSLTARISSDHDKGERASAEAAVNTPVLLERVDSILERAARAGGHGHSDDEDGDNHNGAATSCAANDSSGDGTCDTQQLVQFTDSILLAKASGTIGNRGQPSEEKKDDSGGCSSSVEATGSADEEQGTSLRTPPCPTYACGEDGGMSLSSCSHIAASKSEGGTANDQADGDDSAAVPFDHLVKHEEPPSVPETIEAPCIRPETALLASATDEMIKRAEHGPIDHHSMDSRLSMQLPVTDLTTLEGRFTRRRQQQQLMNGESCGHSTQATTLTASGDASLNLPAFYYSSAIDDTVHVLRSLPWTLLEADEDRVQWDEHIESRLRELDASLSDVQARIATSLSTQDLDAVNNLFHEWQTQLDLALMYSDRAKGSLDEVLEHPDDVEELWRQRETVRDLHTVLQSMDGFVQDKLELDARISAFDATRPEEYARLSHSANGLALQAAGPTLSKVRCLDEHRADVQAFPRRFWDRLLELNRLTTLSACR
jgi:hypothetical protein